MTTHQEEENKDEEHTFAPVAEPEQMPTVPNQSKFFPIMAWQARGRSARTLTPQQIHS